MISGYEIRENTVTPNSVFLLLLKADEAGCKEIEDKLSAFCTLTHHKMKGFDYVFELSGITDDSMLEKIRSKIDFISSSVMGVTQTFANPTKTETITLKGLTEMPQIENTMGDINATYDPLDAKTIKSSMPTLDIANTDGMPSLKLSEDTSFSLSPEKAVTELKDLNYNHDLSNDEMTEVKVEGNSLKIEATDPNIMPEIPSAMPLNQERQSDMPEVEIKKHMSVEEENAPVVRFSEKEMKNVAISIEKKKEKKNIFGGIFNKVKNILNSKKAKDTTQEVKAEEKKEENIPQPKEKSSLFQKAKELKNKVSSSELMKQAQEKAQELKNEVKQELEKEEKGKDPIKEEKNPFQDLGSGIIVKKGLLSSEPVDDVIKKEREDLMSNPITAKLQVDDIFAAETVCNFYADQPEENGKNIAFEQNHQPEVIKPAETPVKKQEKEEVRPEEQANNMPSIAAAQTQKQEEETGLGLGIKTEEIPAIFTHREEVKKEEKPEEKVEKKTEEKKEEKTPSKQPEPIEKEKREEKFSLSVEEKKEEPKKEVEEVKTVEQKEKEEIKKVIEKEKTFAHEYDDLSSVFREKTQKQETLPSFTEIEQEIKKERKANLKEESKPNNGLKPLKELGKKEEKPIIKEENKDFEKENKIMQEQNKEEMNMQQGENGGGMRKDFTSKIDASKRKDKIDHTLHVGTPAKGAKYRNYPIEMPLIPTYTFANMDISPMRFAHAMAMSTLEGLGTSNNPFLLQGVSGTGKTHFLHAMGYEISKQIPQSKILFTNGVRFSRGIQYALEKGQREKLDAFFNGMDVLIIDDIHLTAVNEHNREYISKVLNDFLKNKKQIIFSSKYPPESLQRFEELVNFKFSLGTITELKVPNRTHFTRLVNKLVAAANLELTENQVQEFFCNRCSSLGEVARDIKRVKVLSRRIESSGLKPVSTENILKIMTGINGENEESEIVKKNFEDITVLAKNTADSWGNFGFFFPASQIDKFRWVAFASQEAAKELGIKGGFNYALKSAYSTEHIISAAFKIANICDAKGLKGAVILGPSLSEVKEPIRDNFYDIVTHMLEVMMIRCGTINFEHIKKPSAYIKMLGDILK